MWPPESWKSNKETGKKEPPKKFNFIDERIKWVKSFNDPKKSQEIKDALESKGRIIGELNPFKSDFDKKINKTDLLSSFKNNEEKLKKIKEQINSIPEYKLNAIEQVKEKLKNNEHKPRQGKSDWSKSERIMYNADCEYMGEQCRQIPVRQESRTSQSERRPYKYRLPEERIEESLPSQYRKR